MWLYIRGSFHKFFFKSIKPHDLGCIPSTSYFYSFTLEDLYIIFECLNFLAIVFSYIFGGDVAVDVQQNYLEEIIYIPLPHFLVSSSSSSHNYWFLGSTNHCMRHGSDHHSNCWYDWDWKSINLVWGSPAKIRVQTLSKQIPIHKKIHGRWEKTKL